MTDHYVFQLQFDGTELREKQFVIVDGTSMADYLKLREDLGKCTPEPFVLQYIDDDEDIISIDTEDEFKEFAKLAKKRASKGMMIKLILNSVTPTTTLHTHWQVLKQAEVEMPTEIRDVNFKGPSKQSSKKHEPESCNKIGGSDVCCCSVQKPAKKAAKKAVEKAGDTCAILTAELKSTLKAELLKEMKSEMRVVMRAAKKDPELGAEYDEDSEGSVVPEKRKAKLLTCQKKLEKKEKLAETKIDQRIEKLELKKKMLLEKASLRSTGSRKLVMDTMLGLPFIMSGIQSKETLTVTKIVTVGKVFVHVWHVINDGTIAWANVELRHTWSSPGLEPDETFVQCLPLSPGQVGPVAMKFKAPKTIGTFISYWHLYYLVDTQWQQFGHFISVSGSTKSARTISSVTKKIQESDNVTSTGAKPKLKIVSEEPELSFKKQLDVSLASAQIAAEMTREAVRVAKRQAGGLQMADNIKTNDTKQMDKRLDEAVASVQELNLGESGSDTDGNVDSSDDADPGFVMVDVPFCFVSEKEALQARTAHVKVSFNQSESVKEINTMPSDTSNNTATPNTAEKIENQEADASKVAEGSDTSKKDNQENVEAVNQKVPFNDCESEKPKPLDEMPTNNSFIVEDAEQQPLSFPRLDPNMNYPVFPPPVSVMYPPQHAVPQHAPQGGYPVFPPQNSSSHSLMFPPPPMIHFTAPKMNPVHYQQLPGYAPGSCRPMPLISTMPPPSTIAPSAIPPVSQMPPPCMPQSPPQMINPPLHHIHAPYPINSLFTNSIHRSPPATAVNPATSSTATFAWNQVKESPLNIPQGLPKKVPETQSEELNIPPCLTQKITEPHPEAQPKVADTSKKTDSTVQILPQALVDGAINVAATAYSTAWNALNNLRPKEGEANEFDPVFENNMAILVEMGFNNIERNARLLKRFNNDISQVIGVICATGGGHDLNID